MPEPVDLTNCDREPIHIPGSIQPHGCLIACDAAASVVLHASANAAAMLGLASVPIDGPLVDLFGSSAVHELRNALTTAAGGSRPTLLARLELPGGCFDVAAHRSGSCAIFEFEPAGPASSPLHRTRELIGRIGETEEIDALLRRATRLVHALLGYDRVMVYRFESDGAGKVVSEVKRPDLESFLGQYFPASDIPLQARALYLRNTIRIISDAGNPRVPIEPELGRDGAPLDLSLAHLRSVSPIHCEYLRNMGVGASMSISIVVDGALWGLIACHHYSPRTLSMSDRVSAELFGAFLSLHLHALHQRQRLAFATEARAALDTFVRRAAQQADVATVLAKNLPELARLMPCDGIGVWFEGQWTAYGTTPPPAAVPDLVAHVGNVSGGRTWSSHALGHEHEPAAAYPAEAAGVIAVPLSQLPRDYLFFFRKEYVQTLNWAGNPEKTYTTGPLGDRLTPRQSFAIWKQTVEGQAEPWSEADLEIAEVTRAAMVEVVLRHNELMAEERTKAAFRQRILNEELNHRVKNILAVIKSLVRHPVQSGRSLEEYVLSLQGRIQALAFAHDQVVRGDGGGLLGDLLEAELGPFRDHGATVSINGPGVWLESRAFSLTALILHELATNAAKYGALSRPTGRLDVRWQLTPEGDASIAWDESGGPEVTQPQNAGFGTALIERGIPYDLGGESSLTYRPTGLEARIRLPAAHVRAAGPSASEATEATVAHNSDDARLQPHLEVLLVEDQMLIAMDAEAMLADLGARGVTTVTSVAEAAAHLRSNRPDVAVLDVNLGQSTSIPIAEELAARGVPFIFTTGYGEGTEIPPELGAAPIVRKPYDARALATAIAAVMAADGRR